MIHWKISARGLASSAASSLMRWGQIPSGPYAMLESRADNSENTSEGVTDKESKVHKSIISWKIRYIRKNSKNFFSENRYIQNID